MFALNYPSPNVVLIPIGRFVMTVGSCIYCGTQADQTESKKLSGEHVIPYALGGNLILPKASCDRCAKETSAFEGRLAGKTYEFARTHFHWQSRKRKRPARLKAGSRPPFRDIPVEDHPPGMVQPIFQPPRILLRQPPAEGMECIGVIMCFEPTFLQKIKTVKGISVPFQTNWLCRTFAKIAHSYSALQHGVERFEPFLIDIILGKDQVHYSYYIGNLASTKAARTDDLHTLSYEWMDDLLVVYIRLYSRYGGPTYVVVTGRRKP